MFSRLLRRPAWKRRGPTLVLALHKFVTYLLRLVPIYLQPQDQYAAGYRVFRTLSGLRG